MVEQSEKLVSAMAWLDRMVRLGERLMVAQKATQRERLAEEVLDVVREINADDEVGEAVEELLLSGFLAPDSEVHFGAALEAAVDAVEEQAWLSYDG